MEGTSPVDDELDNLLDATLGDESAEPETPESADDSELADGQAEDESADEEAGDADEATDEGDDEDDELSQLRKRLESVEAERANERAALQTREAQRLAAEEELRLANDEAGWNVYFDQLDEQAWQEAQKTYNPAEAYRNATKQIEQARRAKQAEYARFRSSKFEAAYHDSQRPAYAEYVASHFGLDERQTATLRAKAGKIRNIDDLPEIALTLKEEAELRLQEQRAAKAATLKKSAVKPGGGSPHKSRPKDLDSYLDAILA